MSREIIEHGETYNYEAVTCKIALLSETTAEVLSQNITTVDMV